MNMFIIHGEDQIKSRQFFLSKKDAARKDFAVIDLPGDSLTLSELQNTLGTSSLLGQPTAVFVEGFWGRRPSSEKKVLVEYLKSHPTANIYLWDSKDVSSQLSAFSLQSLVKFDLPKHLFQFIDNWTISNYDLALKSADPEQLLALLAKRVQDLILVQQNTFSGPSWMIGKLQPQTKKYSYHQLTTYNKSLLEIDYKYKTGALPYNLGVALELWLAKM